jgi:hypothetical protein
MCIIGLQDNTFASVIYSELVGAAQNFLLYLELVFKFRIVFHETMIDCLYLDMFGSGCFE